MEEEYRDIEGYEGYQISNLGNVRSLKYNKERILKPGKLKNGYLMVNLCKQGKSKTHKIHRLVAQTFIENPNIYQQVNHKDEDKTNNKVENLEFCDRKYNCNYGTRNQRSAANRSKPVMCVETGVVYPSTKEVERELGFAQGHISSACNGKLKTCGGFHWKYIS